MTTNNSNDHHAGETKPSCRGHGEDEATTTNPLTDGEAVDPVCGMNVTVETAKHVAPHEDETFYICSAGSKAKFDARPAVFLDPDLKAEPTGAADDTYTCPMGSVAQNGLGIHLGNPA